MTAHPMPMSMPLLPEWLRIVWSVALLVVVCLHIWHACSMAGQHRWWHAGHTIMAVGMIWMYLAKPTMAHPAQARTGLVIFAALTAALAVTALVWWRRERALNPLWIASATDMLAMTYMLIPPMSRPATLTWVVVAYLAVQTLAWATGAWGRLPLYRPATPTPGGALPAPVPPAGGHSALAPETTMTATPASTAGPSRTGLSGHTTPGVRVTLAIMAAAMAYMLAAMT